MTLMGYTISESCSRFVTEAEAKLGKRVMYSNEPLEGEKSKSVVGNGYFHFIYFDMNQIDIDEEFEEIVQKELSKLINNENRK